MTPDRMPPGRKNIKFEPSLFVHEDSREERLEIFLLVTAKVPDHVFGSLCNNVLWVEFLGQRRVKTKMTGWSYATTGSSRPLADVGIYVSGVRMPMDLTVVARAMERLVQASILEANGEQR